MNRYLLFPFIIHYVHIYIIAPYLMYIGFHSLQLTTNKKLSIHYKLLILLGAFASIYHMKELWDKSIWIVGLIFILIVIVEYAIVFRRIYLPNKLSKKFKKSKFNL